MERKYKFFRVDEGICDRFEAFCEARKLKQEGVAEALLLWFVDSDASLREEIFLRAQAWKKSQAEGDRPSGAAPTEGEPSVAMDVEGALTAAEARRGSRRRRKQA